jgi:thiamine kinase-like enzyme
VARHSGEPLSAIKNMKKHNSFQKDVDDLLVRAGWSQSDEYRLIGIDGGKNNKLFKVEGKEDNVIIKRFYKHASDSRNRQFSEFSFAQFAWDRGIRSIPRPIDQDTKRDICIYEFVDGRPFKEEQVNDYAIDEAIKFFKDLNFGGVFQNGQHLSRAAEACFTMNEHFHCVDKRVERLQSVDERDSKSEVSIHLRKEIPNLWEVIKQRVQKAAGVCEIDLDRKLETSEWCLSPSDFGFHNALLTADDEIKFFDFEYAGWDDPAKTICDFFCQVSVPVSEKYYKKFSTAIADCFPDTKEKLLQRARLLLPVYRLKWCTIVLNDFLPEGESRRRFAQGKVADKVRKREQLAKSRLLFNAIQSDLNILGKDSYVK